MDVNLSTNLQISNCCIKAFNHLTSATGEFNGLPTIIGSIKLFTIIKGTSVVYTTNLTNITTS